MPTITTATGRFVPKRTITKKEGKFEFIFKLCSLFKSNLFYKIERQSSAVKASDWLTWIHDATCTVICFNHHFRIIKRWARSAKTAKEMTATTGLSIVMTTIGAAMSLSDWSTNWPASICMSPETLTADPFTVNWRCARTLILVNWTCGACSKVSTSSQVNSKESTKTFILNYDSIISNIRQIKNFWIVSNFVSDNLTKKQIPFSVLKMSFLDYDLNCLFYKYCV